MGLSSRYHRLNMFVDDFVRLEKRDRRNTKVSIGLVRIINFTNLYSRLFLWITLLTVEQSMSLEDCISIRHAFYIWLKTGLHCIELSTAWYRTLHASSNMASSQRSVRSASGTRAQGRPETRQIDFVVQFEQLLLHLLAAVSGY